MCSMKNFLYEKEVSYEESGLEEYELYILYKNLSEKYESKTKEELLEYFTPLMNEGEEV